MSYPKGQNHCGFKDRVGQRIGDFIVVSYVGMRKPYGSMWRMRCSCGAEVVRNWNTLQQAINYGITPITCGHHKLTTRVPRPLYSVWQGMKTRCLNTSSLSYPYYGGRGISIDPLWLKYTTFEKDMLPSYTNGLTLDRIDNNGPYSKVNCRWATMATQNNNKTTSIKVNTVLGAMTAKDAASFYGVSITTIYNRVATGALETL